jgi:hypothetical protein
MAGIILTGDTSGTITVNAPAVAGTNTLTLPASTGTMALTSDISSGITMADQWRLSADTNSGTDGFVTTNWERNDNSGWSGIGTGLTESSGVFSFPATGIYLIDYIGRIDSASNDKISNLNLNITLDNSSYTEVCQSGSGNAASGNNSVGTVSSHFLFDVTDVSTHKFRFKTSSFATGTFLAGNTTQQRTGFVVLKLGDT